MHFPPERSASTREESPSGPNGASIGRTIKKVTIAVVVLVVLIVAFQNRAQVSFELLFWSFPIALILLIPLLLLLGFVIGLLAYSLIARQKRRAEARPRY